MGLDGLKFKSIFFLMFRWVLDVSCMHVCIIMYVATHLENLIPSDG